MKNTYAFYIVSLELINLIKICKIEPPDLLFLFTIFHKCLERQHYL